MHVLRVRVRVCIWWKAGNACRTGEPSVALSLSVLSEAAALTLFLCILEMFLHLYLSGEIYTFRSTLYCL